MLTKKQPCIFSTPLLAIQLSVCFHLITECMFYEEKIIVPIFKSATINERYAVIIFSCDFEKCQALSFRMFYKRLMVIHTVNGITPVIERQPYEQREGMYC